MDLTAEYYMQTIETVFVRHELPKGEMKHRGVKVDPGAIRRCALMTVEGEKDDISGVGQTQAAHDLCVNIPPALKQHYLQVGSATTAFSTARDSAPTSPRASPIFTPRSTGGRSGRGSRAGKRRRRPRSTRSRALLSLSKESCALNRLDCGQPSKPASRFGKLRGGRL